MDHDRAPIRLVEDGENDVNSVCDDNENKGKKKE